MSVDHSRGVAGYSRDGDKKRLKLLIVEDSENDTLLIVRELAKGGYHPEYQRIETAESLAHHLDVDTWDLVITDHNLPSISSVDVLQIIKGMGLDIPVIIVSGVIGEKLAVEAMRAGAHDYVMKDNMVRLVPAIERELRDAKIRQEKEKAERALTHLSHHDSLTNLVNRTLLIDSLSSALARARARSTKLALLCIDLDRFKIINDTYGFEIGDRVLQEVAKRLRHCARYDDTLARYDSDEFILIFENVSDDIEAFVLADMIIKQLTVPYSIDGHEIHARVSIGIAFSDEISTMPEELIQNAEAATQQAKSKGRNSFEVYSSEMSQAVEHRRYLELSLYHALENNEFELYFQPQVNMQTGKLRGAEVLLRWRHGTLGLVPPDEFIGLLEEMGLIIQVGEWVLKTASHQWKQWIEQGAIPGDAILSVNISSYQFRGELVGMVQRVVEETGISAKLLDLEITESTLMDDTEQSQRALESLRDLGVQFAIDDFGTGYSSLSYLTRFPVNTLKIDKSFILGVSDNKNDEVITKAIIGLANNLSLSVIAEGVENTKAIEFLVAQGCHVHQGYYFSKPLPADDFLKKVCSAFPGGVFTQAV